MTSQFGIWTKDYGLEPRLYLTSDQALNEASELSELAAYRGIELRIVRISIDAHGENSSMATICNLNTPAKKEIH
jgi:hypothetical protein